MQAMGSLASPAAHPRLLQAPPPTCRFQQYRPFVAANPHTRRPWQRASGKGLQWHVQRASAEPDDAALLAEVPEPEDARGAIAVGLDLYNAGDYDRALGMFEKALSLPGTGLKQFRDKPPAISNGEKQAALYNLACCYSRQGNLENGLRALANCLEAGYEDYEQMKVDPDLEAVRTDQRFNNLMGNYNKGGGGGFFGTLLKGFQM